MPRKRKPKAVMVDGIPIKADQPGRTQAAGPANQEEVRKAATPVPGGSRQESGLDFARIRGGIPVIHVRFADGKNFAISCSPTIVTDFVDFSDIKTGDDVIIREIITTGRTTDGRATPREEHPGRSFLSNEEQRRAGRRRF